MICTTFVAQKRFFHNRKFYFFPYLSLSFNYYVYLCTRCTSLVNRCTFLCNNPAFPTSYGLCRSSLILPLFCFLINWFTVFYFPIAKYSHPRSCRAVVFPGRYIYYCIDRLWRTYLCNKPAVFV